MTLESRAWLADLEIRSTGDGRTVRGLAAPFDRPAEIHDWGGTFVESIRRGSFARTIRERGAKVKFRVEHVDRPVLPIGRATSLVEDHAGLVAELRVSQTQAGDEALELIGDGVLDALSIGFRVPSGGDVWSADRSRRELHEIRLDEISLVTEAAYSEAKVLAVRAGAQPSLTAARARLQLLQKANPPR